MKQTPTHEQCNPDLLSLIPAISNDLIEIGCSSGALAREFKKINPACRFSGVEISPDYAEAAKRYCDDVVVLDIDTAGPDFYAAQKARDCWIFGDILEHLKDPWRVLSQVRSVMQAGSIVACIPNVQHWSIQARLSGGDFRYEDIGLFDRTHLRWFTRQTIIELFKTTGFSIVEGFPRIFDEPQRERFLPAIREMALRAGFDPDMAVNDSLPTQYVVKAHPV